jgi:GR25 family glycosyltransferase involved in LPS biosynthesis
MIVLILLIFLFIIVFNNYTNRTNIDTFEDVKKEIAYVINLDSRTDRWTKIQDKFKDSEFQLERFSAIKDSVGWKGCGYSHMALIEKAKNDNMPSILIMEDDCVPSKEFNEYWPKIKKWLDTNKDSWDIFIGGNTYYGSVFVSPQDKQLNTIKPICFIEPNIKLYVTKMLTTTYYYLNSSAYDKFLEWKNDIDKNGAVDVWPNTIKMKIISCIPFIATQESDYSDIDNTERTYNHIFKNSEEVISSIQNNSVCNN